MSCYQIVQLVMWTVLCILCCRLLSLLYFAITRRFVVFFFSFLMSLQNDSCQIIELGSDFYLAQNSFRKWILYAFVPHAGFLAQNFNQITKAFVWTNSLKDDFTNNLSNISYLSICCHRCQENKFNFDASKLHQRLCSGLFFAQKESRPKDNILKIVSGFYNNSNQNKEITMFFLDLFSSFCLYFAVFEFSPKSQRTPTSSSKQIQPKSPCVLAKNEQKQNYWRCELNSVL